MRVLPLYAASATTNGNLPSPIDPRRVPCVSLDPLPTGSSRRGRCRPPCSRLQRPASAPRRLPRIAPGQRRLRQSPASRQRPARRRPSALPQPPQGCPERRARPNSQPPPPAAARIATAPAWRHRRGSVIASRTASIIALLKRSSEQPGRSPPPRLLPPDPRVTVVISVATLRPLRSTSSTSSGSLPDLIIRAASTAWPHRPCPVAPLLPRRHPASRRREARRCRTALLQPPRRRGGLPHVHRAPVLSGRQSPR